MDKTKIPSIVGYFQHNEPELSHTILQIQDIYLVITATVKHLIRRMEGKENFFKKKTIKREENMINKRFICFSFLLYYPYPFSLENLIFLENYCKNMGTSFFPSGKFTQEIMGENRRQYQDKNN